MGKSTNSVYGVEASIEETPVAQSLAACAGCREARGMPRRPRAEPTDRTGQAVYAVTPAKPNTHTRRAASFIPVISLDPIPPLFSLVREFGAWNSHITVLTGFCR